MSDTVQWVNEEKTILDVFISGQWTWEEFEAAFAKLYAMIAEVDYVVDVIGRLKSGEGMPSGNALQHFRRAMSNRPDNVGIFVVVGGSAFVRTISSIFARTYYTKRTGRTILFATSLEEACAKIAEQRQSEATGERE